MLTGELRIQPPAEILDATRQWLDKVRPALGGDLLAAYLRGSVLTQGFDPKRSEVDVLVVARELTIETIDALRKAIPETKKPPHFKPLFLTRAQIEKSLDVFPIEWVDIAERHLRIEGEDIFEGLEVPRTFLRLQCEAELRGRHIKLRQAYLDPRAKEEDLARILHDNASTFSTLFRTLLRLHGETPPADNGRLIERVADVFRLDVEGLLVAHLLRYSGGDTSGVDVTAQYRKFLVEIGRLVIAIDQLRVT